MRFGMFLPQGWRLDLVGIERDQHWPLMQQLAQGAGAAGFDSVWVYDHFHTFPGPTHEATHEAWSLMAALAATTTDVRLGQMCTCVGYRNPMYLAKVAATVDVISGGRLEMGLGGGWYENEWMAYGYGFPPIADRLAMLEESAQILQQAWTTGQATFGGEHYQVESAICQPQPIQPDGPPLWIVGGGEKKTLLTAAKYAQYTNFSGNAEEFAHKSQVLRDHCRDVGRDAESIVCSANYNVIIGTSESEVADRLARIEERVTALHREGKIEATGVAAHMELLRSKGLTGTVEQVTQRLSDMRQAGLGYAIAYFPELAYDDSGWQLFHQQVMPQLVW